MKMYIGDSDFLYKSLVRNTDKETVECLMPYLEFTRHINDMKIIRCNGIVYMRSIDALTRRIQTVQSNMVINLAVNLN